MVWNPGTGPDPNRPDPREVARQLWAELGGLRRWFFLLVVGLGLVLGFLTSYAQVEPDEVGVIVRLGRFTGTVEPGPHFRLPFGVERIVKVPVQRQLKAEFGFRTERPGSRSTYSST